MSRRAPSLVILDFDGVVADSEAIANQALADYLTRLGHPTTLEQSIRMFMGRRYADTLASIVRITGKPIPDDFEETYRAPTRVLLRETVQPVRGVVEFLSSHRHLERCVASSSTHEWLNHCVDRFGLRPDLGGRLYSATEVKTGKPAPDIFLHAASRMGHAPEAAVVLEDSVAGVEGAVAAGMRVIGFLGGSHILDGHGEALTAAGAHAIARSFEEVARLIGDG